jgi:hypothetical protein
MALILILLGLGGSVPSLASTPPPYAGHCAILDRVAVAAGNVRTRSVAIDSLEKVALGRATSVGAESEVALGEKAGVFEDRGFGDPPARVCALRSIGTTALEEAVDFLTKLEPGDLGSDPSQTVWPAAQIALREAQLGRITDPDMKIEFLEHTISEYHDAVSNSAVILWAVNQLCDRGAQASLPVIQKSIRHMWSGQNGEDEVEFCEARVRVVTSKPDRVAALASVLSVAIGADDANQRLLGWAVNELNSMKSSDADAQLDRFARDIERLPEGSPTKVRLSTYREEIVQFKGQRAR